MSREHFRYTEEGEDGIRFTRYGVAWPFGRVVQNIEARAHLSGAHGTAEARSAWDAKEPASRQPLTVDMHTDMGGLVV